MSKIYTEKFYAVSVLSGHVPRESVANAMAPVSQFTLLAKVKKGNKPDFHGAAPVDKAKELYDYFYSKVGELYATERVKNGVFRAMMDVGLVNDGPVRTNIVLPVKLEALQF